MLLRALAFVTGVAGAALPEKSIEIGAHLTVVGFENPADLEPSDWFVDAVRYAAVLLAVAALIAPFLPTPSEGGDEEGGDDEGADAVEETVVDVIQSSDE